MKRFALAACVLLVACSLPVLTATNAVPGTYASQNASAITGNDLKPASCAAVNVANVVVGTTGTNVSDLVLGTAAGTLVRGRQAQDCILGGGGNDTIDGEQGSDVCIGGPGTDTFLNCETQIQ